MKKFIEDHAIRLNDESATIHYNGYQYDFEHIDGNYILSDHKAAGAHLVITDPNQLDSLNNFGTPLYSATADVHIITNDKCTAATTINAVTTVNHHAGGVWVSDLSTQENQKRIERTFINVEKIQ